jgi:hypothetical protein
MIMECTFNEGHWPRTSASLASALGGSACFVLIWVGCLPKKLYVVNQNHQCFKNM